VLDKANGRCLHYERILPGRQKPFLSLPAEVLQAPMISIRDDLLDCYIDICSQDVPALFTENFDYQHIRGHFVHGILQDHELYGKTIHCYITRKDYIARVRGLQTYDAITKDIVSGWAYPICVDHNLFDDMDYTKTRNHIYRENDVTLTRSSLLKPNTVVGAHTSVGENTVLSGSVIGRQCKIGENVKVDGAYVWDHVQIGNNCDIGKAIIASNVVLGENVKVMSGAVISHNVTVAPGTTVYSDHSVTATNGADIEEEQETDVGVVGQRERYFLYEDSESDSDEIKRIAASRLPHQKRTALLTVMEDNDSDTSYISSSDESTFSEVSSASATKRRPKKSKQKSKNSVATPQTDYSATSNEDDPDEIFFNEAYSSLLTALEANHPVEVAALELNSLRMSSNASFDLVRRAVAKAFVAQLGQLTSNVKLADVKDIVLAFAKQWHSLCKRTVFSPSDQVELILELQKASLGLRKDFGTRVFGYTLQGLYNEDVLPEESILAWQKHPSGRLNNGQEVRSIADQFANWLASAESDDSDESGEEESDEE
jgi:translation initiation factor eIF-2B subunit epsilon